MRLRLPRRAVRHPGHLADLAGYSPDFSIEQKVEVLETLDIEQRLSRLIAWTKDVLADAYKVSQKVKKTTRKLSPRKYRRKQISFQLGLGIIGM